MPSKTYVPIILLILSLLPACERGGDNQDQAEPIYGAKIYAYEGDADSLFTEWADLGLNAAWIGKELFANPEIRTAARAHNIASYVVFPTFFDPAELDADASLSAITSMGEPAVSDWVRFVCPSDAEFRRRKIDEVARIVHEWQPDGISIDFIRHFVFWETIFPETKAEALPNTCFDDRCMIAFQEETGLTRPDSVRGPVASANWIQENHQETWINWKCTVITRMAEEIVSAARAANPDIKIMIHIVPWLPGEYDDAIRRVAGQDVEALSRFADIMSPMAYHHMVKRPPGWIIDIVTALTRQSAAPVIPSIQAGKAYLEEPLTPEIFRTALSAALSPPSHGVIFWEWAHLAESPEKRKIISELLSDR